MRAFDQKTYRSADGLELAYRDYPARTPAAPVLLCLPGLTRNSKDFNDFANALEIDVRLVCPDFRGRGLSAYDPDPTNYNPLKELEDTLRLLETEDISRCIPVGTSRGGIVTMLMANVAPERMTAAILNDIGPELDPRGLARIMAYVGRVEDPADWPAAVDAVKRLNGEAFPTLSEAEWEHFTRQLFREENGQPKPDYDRKLGDATRASGAETPPDLWPQFEALTNFDTLLVQGELSDLLSDDIVSRMSARHPRLTVVKARNRGHAPFLTEPEVLEAIGSFLRRVTQSEAASGASPAAS